MGIFNIFGSKGKKSLIEATLVVPKLNREFKAMREQFYFGSISTMKSEGVDLPSISPLLQEASEPDSALKGFQLTSILGFSQRYLGPKDWLAFEAQLYGVMANNDSERTHFYNERYLDCRGEIDCLSIRLAQDIYRIWNNPLPVDRLIAGLKSASKPFAILSQAVTAAAFGDNKTELELKGLLKI